MTKFQITTFITLVVIASLGVVVCNEIIPPEVVGVESFQINNMSASGGSIDVGVRIKNENNIKFTITSCKMDVISGNSKIGTAEVTNNIVIPKKSEDLHTFKITAKFNGIAGAFAAAMNMFGGKKEFTFKGEVKVRTMGITKKFPIEFSHAM